MTFENEESILFAILTDCHLSFKQRIRKVHQLIRLHFEYIDRIAIALYDENTDILKTFADSTMINLEENLHYYQAKLSQSSSLTELMRARQPRVINQLHTFDSSEKKHTQHITTHYQASYTLPLYQQGHFFGFVFFNSTQSNVFTKKILYYLNLFGHLIGFALSNEMQRVHTLQAAVKSASNMALQRDFETGCHIERTAHFSRLIAMGVAEHFGLSDELIEYIFLFAPLHDIGKIAIPDHILLKPGKFEPHEYEIMKTHTTKGAELITDMLHNFKMNYFIHSKILYDIVRSHHETLDGTGYPDQLKGEEIPLVARIISIADIFDALTSARPYKDPWSNQEAFDLIRNLAGKKLDPICVNAFLQCSEKILEIQQQFVDGENHR